MPGVTMRCIILLLIFLSLFAFGQLEQQPFAVVKIRWTAVYAAPSVGSEQLTEAFFGEPVLILKKSGNWSKISLPLQQQRRKDGSWGGYRGWIQNSSMSTPAGRTISDYLGKQLTLHTSSDENRIPVFRIKNSKPIFHLYCLSGTLLPDSGKAAGMRAVILPDGDRGLVYEKNARVIMESRSTLTFTERFINHGRRYLGTRYLRGGTGGAGLDCSGLVYLAARTAGLFLPRDSGPQHEVVQKIPADQARRGDLVFFSTTRPGPSHVGIYLGNNRILHAYGKQVQISLITDVKRTATLLGFGRSRKITGSRTGQGYAAPAGTAIETDSNSRLFSLHLSSVRNPENLVKVLSRLRNRSGRIFIIPVKRSGRLFYALYYEIFPTLQDARRFRKQHKAADPIHRATQRRLPLGKGLPGKSIWSWQTMSLLNPGIALQNLKTFHHTGKDAWLFVCRDRRGRQWFCMMGGRYSNSKIARKMRGTLGPMLHPGTNLRRFR